MTLSFSSTLIATPYTVAHTTEKKRLKNPKKQPHRARTNHTGTQFVEPHVTLHNTTSEPSVLSNSTNTVCCMCNPNHFLPFNAIFAHKLGWKTRTIPKLKSTFSCEMVYQIARFNLCLYPYQMQSCVLKNDLLENFLKTELIIKMQHKYQTQMKLCTHSLFFSALSIALRHQHQSSPRTLCNPNELLSKNCHGFEHIIYTDGEGIDTFRLVSVQLWK